MSNATQPQDATAAISAGDPTSSETPAPVEVTVGGKTFRLHPKPLGWHASRERFILQNRPDSGRQIESVLRSDLPSETKDRLMLEIVRSANLAQFVSWSELSEFENSPLGLSWAFQQAVRPDYPELSIDDARQILDSLTVDEARALLTTL